MVRANEKPRKGKSGDEDGEDGVDGEGDDGAERMKRGRGEEGERMKMRMDGGTGWPGTTTEEQDQNDTQMRTQLTTLWIVLSGNKIV